MEYSTVEDAGRYLYDHPLVWIEPTAQVHPAPGPTTLTPAVLPATLQYRALSHISIRRPNATP